MANLLADATAYNTLLIRLRALVSRAAPGHAPRAWIAGCGTGEDAYAVAILLDELAPELKVGPAAIFATESDIGQLAAARAGVFDESALARLDAEQRERLFFPAGGRWHVKGALREQVIFASHHLLSDPPFSRLDLVICRRLFAGLTSVERPVGLERLAFALRPGGLLLLDDETLIDLEETRFLRVDRGSLLFRRTSAPVTDLAVTSAVAPSPLSQLSPLWRPEAPPLADGSPGLLVDASDRVVFLGPGVERFLRIAAGSPSYDVAEVALPELREAVTTTLQRARARRRAAESPPVRAQGADETITVVVQPVADDSGEHVVLFDVAAAPADVHTGGAHEHASLEPQLDLAALQARHDVVYEELIVANAELQALNEELRSSSEELETRREELETLNLQLQLVNREQRQTLAALQRSNADLENLIASAEIATLFLDGALRVQRYTAPVQRIMNLLPGDLGRPLAQLTHQLRYERLADDAGQVLSRLEPVEREARHADGRWFLVRLQPYRSAEGQVTGVVLTFLDITGRRLAEEALRESHAELERRVEERTAELRLANAGRQTLLRDLVQAQEAERLRIARELHDTLGQQITATLLGLQSVRELSQGRAATLERLEQVWAIVQAMGSEMHEIAVNLRPTALDDVGLAGALRGYVEGWSRRTGIAAELYVTGIERKSLPLEVETTLYRVAQEALTNVARHAEATRVSLVLECGRGRVVGVIEDNGRGFLVEDALHASGQGVRLGLLGMRERVALVGGSLTIESGPQAGTTLIARIPLPLEEEVPDGLKDSARR